MDHGTIMARVHVEFNQVSLDESGEVAALNALFTVLSSVSERTARGRRGAERGAPAS